MFGFFKNTGVQTTKGVVAALFFMLGGAILFAVIYQAASLPSSVVRPVNQTIRICAVLLACLLFLREERGALKGCMVGAGSSLVAWLVFGVIGKSFAPALLLLFDCFVSALVGVLSGIIAVNCKRSR